MLGIMLARKMAILPFHFTCLIKCRDFPLSDHPGDSVWALERQVLEENTFVLSNLRPTLKKRVLGYAPRQLDGSSLTK